MAGDPCFGDTVTQPDPPVAPGGPSTGSAPARTDQLIRLDVRDVGAAATVVEVGGEVDMLTTPQLQGCVHEQLARGRGLLVLDLGRLTFLGSSGLAVLVGALDTARARDTALRLVGSSREVLRPLEATGLTGLFATYPDVDAALADPV